jgi:hypothetical protein
MKEFVVKDKWVRVGTHRFPSFNLGVSIGRYQFAIDLVFFWFEIEF